MAKRGSLRDFQEGLASRLKAAAVEAAPSARLSFESGGGLWLMRLEGSGEVLPVPEIARVPLAKSWFLGVANIRGVIYGVSDFSAFLGKEPTVRGLGNRLLLVGQPHALNAALLVTRLAGLRNVSEFEAVENSGPGAEWAEASYRDADQRVWRELDSAKLLAHRDFLDIALH